MVDTLDKYQLYLKSQLDILIQNEKAKKPLEELMYKAFLDGVKFGQGKLYLEVEDD